jgi:hypothetical protein
MSLKALITKMVGVAAGCFRIGRLAMLLLAVSYVCSASPIPSPFNNLTATLTLCANGFVGRCKAGADYGSQDSLVSPPDGSRASLLHFQFDDLRFAVANGFAEAAYGSLRADAHALQNSSTSPFFSQAIATASSIDAIGSTTSTPGVSVALYDLNVRFEGSLSPNAVYAEAGGCIKIATTNTIGSGYCDYPFNFTETGFHFYSFHTQLSIQPGQVLFISEFLRVAATADSIDETYSTSDFSNTVTTYIDPITPGVELISASGHDYSTPSSATVPEPSSLTFMCLAFALFGVRCFEKKGGR